MTAAPDVHPSLVIPHVLAWLKSRRKDGVALLEVFHTDCSSEILRRLETAANVGEEVTHLTIDGRILDDDSLKALNAYLRTPHALNPNGVLPFNRITGTRSRWDWSMFCDYLDFTFSA